jgi:hypothetical protein
MLIELLLFSIHHSVVANHIPIGLNTVANQGSSLIILSDDQSDQPDTSELAKHHKNQLPEVPKRFIVPVTVPKRVITTMTVKKPATV